jgi:hypothetical protein
MRALSVFSIFMLALTIAACAAAPQTPKQTMAATYVAIETLADTALLAFESGDIDRDTTTRIYKKLQEAKTYVDLSAVLEGSTLTDGDRSRLELVRDLLVEVEAMIRENANE